MKIWRKYSTVKALSSFMLLVNLIVIFSVVRSMESSQWIIYLLGASASLIGLTPLLLEFFWGRNRLQRNQRIGLENRIESIWKQMEALAEDISPRFKKSQMTSVHILLNAYQAMLTDDEIDFMFLLLRRYLSILCTEKSTFTIKEERDIAQRGEALIRKMKMLREDARPVITVIKGIENKEEMMVEQVPAEKYA